MFEFCIASFAKAPAVVHFQPDLETQLENGVLVDNDQGFLLKPPNQDHYFFSIFTLFLFC